ncbi:MAG: hypothetical protein QM765_08295 [Myxococcales bacterium]
MKSRAAALLLHVDVLAVAQRDLHHEPVLGQRQDLRFLREDLDRELPQREDRHALPRLPLLGRPDAEHDHVLHQGHRHALATRRVLHHHDEVDAVVGLDEVGAGDREREGTQPLRRDVCQRTRRSPGRQRRQLHEVALGERHPQRTAQDAAPLADGHCARPSLALPRNSGLGQKIGRQHGPRGQVLCGHQYRRGFGLLPGAAQACRDDEEDCEL